MVIGLSIGSFDGRALSAQQEFQFQRIARGIYKAFGSMAATRSPAQLQIT